MWISAISFKCGCGIIKLMGKSSRILMILVLIGAGFFWFFFSKPSAKDMQADVDELQILATKDKNYTLCLDKASSAVKKYPENNDVWQWKAICEFQSGNFTEAKTSFEKLLALDPASEVAKNYLNTLNSGSKLINTGNIVSAESAVSNLDFSIDAKILRFDRVLPLGEGATSIQYLSFKSFTETKAYLSSQLQKAGLTFTQKGLTQRFSYFVTGKKKNIDYTISIFDQTPVKVIIDIAEKR